MLTPKQRQLLEFLNTSLSVEGICPSYDEMRQALGLKSKSGIHRLIHSLEERGYIQKLVNRARAIEILKFPESNAKALKNFLSIPLLGRIAAGTPVEAIQEPRDHLRLPSEMFSAGEHYALEVVGDSMKEAGIEEGDQVVIRRQPRAEMGEIVVALIKGEEVTLKRYYKEGKTIRLKAENRRYKDQVYPAQDVEIQGKLVYLLRPYA